MGNQGNLEQERGEAFVYCLKSLLSQVKIGMAESQIISLLGKPSGYDVSRTATVKSEQLTYTGPDLSIEVGHNLWGCDISTIRQYEHFQINLFFENDVLTRIQGF